MKVEHKHFQRHPAPDKARDPRRSTYNGPVRTGAAVRRPWLREFKAGPVENATIKTEAFSGRQLDDLLERPEKILIIESADLPGTLQQFEKFARQSGKAIYLWRPEQGLNSLKVADMRVPGSGRLTEALRYVAKSLHYGVYGFVEFEPSLNMDALQLLQEISRAQTGYDRKVLLMSGGFRVPRVLQNIAARISHRPERRLRLRDGRWIL